MTDLANIVASSADAADLGAPVPALLLELQTSIGTLTATANEATERGRRPFRPPAEWGGRLGAVAYGLFLIADQSGVDLAREIEAVAEGVQRSAAARRADTGSWPFEG